MPNLYNSIPLARRTTDLAARLSIAAMMGLFFRGVGAVVTLTGVCVARLSSWRPIIDKSRGSAAAQWRRDRQPEAMSVTELADLPFDPRHVGPE